MGHSIRQPPTSRTVLSLSTAQHGVASRVQLLGLGLTSSAITYRIRRRRLHVLFPGVYAVGRPDLTLQGWMLAAAFACGAGAVLSHESAAILWGLIESPPWATFSSRAMRPSGPFELSVSPPRTVARPGLIVHRRRALGPLDVSEHDGIPLTSPVRTLVDLAARESAETVERAINRADKRGVATPDRLVLELARLPLGPGVALLRALLDRDRLILTDSVLEQRFLPIAHRAGLGPPKTQQRVSGYRVDFWWPQLGLVVETDGLRYHRTAADQARDLKRDQAHAAAGLASLRFTHHQIAHEAASVEATLRQVAERQRGRLAGK